MQLKAITAIVVLLLLVASLCVAGCSTSNQTSPYYEARQKQLAAYDTFKANIRNESAAVVKNNSSGFRTVSAEAFRKDNNSWTFSGDFIVFWNGPNLIYSDQETVYLKLPKDGNFTHTNLTTVFYVVKTKLDKTERYMTGEVGYWARYDIYAIKYPEMTPLVKITTDVPPPYSKELDKEVIGADSEVLKQIIDHQYGKKSDVADLLDMTVTSGA